MMVTVKLKKIQTNGRKPPMHKPMVIEDKKKKAKKMICRNKT